METVVDRLLDEAMTELGHQENKATRVLAALTVATGVLVAGLFAGGWRPASLDTLGTGLWMAGGLALILALAFVGVAVMISPHPANATPDSRQTFQSLLDEIVQRDGDPAGRLWAVRAALVTKRRLLGLGLSMAGAGFGLCAAVGLAS
jgi:hypothetical protein